MHIQNLSSKFIFLHFYPYQQSFKKQQLFFFSWFYSVQLTFEQYRFELCGSTYTWVFFINTVALHYPLLVESSDVEPQIQRNLEYGGQTILLYLDSPAGGWYAWAPPCT